jgi:hypothetical protein
MKDAGCAVTAAVPEWLWRKMMGLRGSGCKFCVIGEQAGGVSRTGCGSDCGAATRVQHDHAYEVSKTKTILGQHSVLRAGCIELCMLAANADTQVVTMGTLMLPSSIMSGLLLSTDSKLALHFDLF